MPERTPYLPGSDLVGTVTKGGNLTTYSYDYRQRVISTTVQPKAGVKLTKTKVYSNNQLVQEADYYGRKSYSVYRSSDGLLIRSVQGTVPEDGLTLALVQTATRVTPDINAKYAITDYTLDAAGQKLKVTDSRGVDTVRVYDSLGRMVEETKAAGTAIAAKTQYDYDAQGNKIQIRFPRHFTEAGGFVTKMMYTGRNLLTSKTEALGRPEEATEQYTYYLDGRQYQVIDARGSVWTKIWSCCGRLAADIGPEVLDANRQAYRSANLYNYDFIGNRTHEAVVQWSGDLPTDAVHDAPDTGTLQEITRAFDARGRKTAETKWLMPRGNVDSTNPPIATDPIQGLTTRWLYDGDLTDGQGLDQCYAGQLGKLGSAYFGIGSVGSAVAVCNPNGETQVTVLDSLDRMIMNVDPEGQVSLRAYDVLKGGLSGAPGTLTGVVQSDALSHSTTTFSDALGRNFVIQDSLAKSSVRTFDAIGNTLRIRDPNGVGSDVVYDSLGRQVQTTDTHGESIQWNYDAQGNLLSMTDAKGKSDQILYDGRNRKVSYSSAQAGDTTTYAFDTNNNQVSITDGEGKTTSYGFDAMNRKILETYPDDDIMAHSGLNDHIRYTFNALNRVVALTDQSNVTIELGFDLAGRLIARTYPDMKNDQFAYDFADRLTCATSGRYGNVVRKTYDKVGRVSSETLTVGAQSYKVQYSYDAAGRNVTMAYPDGSVVSRGYTARDELLSVGYMPSKGVSRSIITRSYDNGGRIGSTKYGNGLVETRTYRMDNLMDSINTPGVSGFRYQYDNNKNKTDEIDSIMPSWSWSTGSSGYDDKNRLINWNRGSGDNQSWNLTPVGDWSSVTLNGQVESRQYNNVHALISRGTTPLVYDVKGNLTKDANSQILTWDFDNRMSSSTTNGITTVYCYDALGRRIGKNNGNISYIFVHAMQQEIAEYGNGKLQKKYVYGNYIDEPVLMVNICDEKEDRFYYHTNSVYSVTSITNQSGLVVERYSYLPYGNSVSVQPTPIFQPSLPPAMMF